MTTTRRTGRGHMPTFIRKKDWDASVERDSDRQPCAPLGRSEVRTWLCPSCRIWTVGAFMTGVCNLCGRSRPNPRTD